MSMGERMTENYRWLAGVIAAHPERRIETSSQLQNTVKLLQYIGMPTDYHYMKLFHGPYSEGVQADLSLLTTLGLIKERKERKRTASSRSYEASEKAILKEMDQYSEEMKAIGHVNLAVLDCAATYLAFRELGLSDEEAVGSVCRKKRDKCDPATTDQALNSHSA